MPTATGTALLTSIAAATRERLGAAACSVALVEAGELRFVAADGVGAAEVLGLRLPLGRGIAGYVVASGQALAVADVHRDTRFDREAAASTGYVPTTILAVPVDDEEGPTGVLEVLDREPGPHDLEVAAAAAAQVALVHELTTRSDDVERLLGDPALVDLVDLLRRLADASPGDRSLAASLLRAVLEARG